MLSTIELCSGGPALHQALVERIRDGRNRRDLSSRTAGETADAAPDPPRLKGVEILGILGRGGMGVVYKGRQAELDRFVAVKMIVSGPYAGPDELGRFRREAEAIGRLQHPNIVQIYEIGEHNGFPYVVLEFAAGGSLAEHLNGTPLPARAAAQLVLAVARAVEHAHARGVLHRDLKPANVLLTADGTPKISDFGLAKRLDTDPGETQTGVILGSPSYMAPEQASGKVHELGPATDVYGLGALLYECLTGRAPFKGVTVLETLEQVRTHDPVPPRALQPQVPRDLETICLKCLEKEPGHRYRSADALARDLDSFLSGESIRARSLTPLERVAGIISYSGSPAFLRTRSTGMLLLSPLPLLVQLMLFLSLRHWPCYPVICMALGVLVFSVGLPVVLWMTRDEFLRRAPRAFRRHLWSVMITRSAGGLMVPALVALMRPGEDLAEFFLVFPLWIFLEGNVYFVLGSDAGGGYLLAVVHYAAAVLVTVVPTLGPLAIGCMVSISLLLFGLYLRRLTQC